MTELLQQASIRNRWLPFSKIGLQAGEELLLCFPYAGVSAAIYRKWAEQLPASLELMPVELPGHGGRLREAPLHSVAEMGASAADALAHLCQGRYSVFGHSLGAMVAFEMVRILVGRGQPPVHLFVSGCRAPHVLPIHRGSHLLPPHALRQRLRSWGGAPEEVLMQSELMTQLEPALRADLEAVENYLCVSSPDVGVPITAFAGMSDPLAPPESVAEWSQYTSDYFAMRLVPGNHFFLHQFQPLLLGLIAREFEFAHL